MAQFSRDEIARVEQAVIEKAKSYFSSDEVLAETRQLPILEPMTPLEEVALLLVLGRSVEIHDAENLFWLAFKTQDKTLSAQAKSRLREMGQPAAELAVREASTYGLTEDVFELLRRCEHPWLHQHVDDLFSRGSSVPEYVLPMVEHQSEEVIADWLAAQSNLDPDACAEALEVSDVRGRVVPILVKRYERDAMRIGNARALALAAEPSAERLFAEALTHSRRETRDEAKRGLLALKGPYGESVHSLIFQESPEARAAAIDVLCNRKFAMPLGLLLRSVQSECAEEAIAAIRAVRALRERDRLGVALPMVEAAKSPNPLVRQEAAATLGKIPTKLAIDSLTNLASDVVPATRRSALSALGEMLALSRRGPAYTEGEMAREICGTMLRLMALSEEKRNGTESEILAMYLARVPIGALRDIATALSLDPETMSAVEATLMNVYERQEALGSLPAYCAREVNRKPRVRIAHAVEKQGAEIPSPIKDEVYFTVTGPLSVSPGDSVALDVWAHLDGDRDSVRRASAGKPILRSRGPELLSRGQRLGVTLRIAALSIEKTDTILWTGKIGSCPFLIDVPTDFAAQRLVGDVIFTVAGVNLSTLSFDLPIGVTCSERTDLTLKERRVRCVFASYAAEDRDDVLARIQGMHKVLPDLDVFLDILSLRAGDDWKLRIEREIVCRDAFFLFWSRAASVSQWVEWEWRKALGRRGLSFIDPVPLVDPFLSPPPTELAALHFNDRYLACQSGRAESRPGESLLPF